MSVGYLPGLAAVVLMGGCVDTSVAAAPPGVGNPQPIAVFCAPGVGAQVERQDLICAEFVAALRQSRPDLHFVTEGRHNPSLTVTITQANARGIGLTVVWTDAAGRRIDGVPLRVSFFDRASDAALRTDFYRAFLRDNPAPF